MIDIKRFIKERDLSALTEKEILEISKQFKNKGHHLKRVNAAIVKFGIDSKRVIDVGSGFGHCLMNFGKCSFGIEVAAYRVEFSKAIGLNVIEWDLNNETELPLEDEAYDVIWASDILEHLHSPHRILKNLRKKLKPDGLLIAYVTTLPGGFLWKALWRKLFHLEGYKADAHLYQWTWETASFLIEKTGFRVVDRYITPTGIIPLNWFLSKLFLKYFPSCTIAAVNNNQSEKAKIEI